MAFYVLQDDAYCSTCLPLIPSSAQVRVESRPQDQPVHCCVCHVFIETELSKWGVSAIFDGIESWLDLGPTLWNKCFEEQLNTAYAEMRCVEVVRDWAIWLEAHETLTDEEFGLVEHFLQATDYEVYVKDTLVDVQKQLENMEVEELEELAERLNVTTSSTTTVTTSSTTTLKQA